MKSLDLTFKPFSPASLGFVAILIAAFGISNAQADADKKKAPTGAKPKAEAAVPATAPEPAAKTDLQSFGNMIPLGSRSRGFVLPSFENGKPSSLITADAMTRVDDSRLFAEKMIIRMFGETNDQDVRVDLKTGTYNLDQQILSSNERSRVSRNDFQIEGDGMVFDTKSSQGKMVGNVEMIIYDIKSMAKTMGGPAAAEGKEKAAPSATDKKEKAAPPVSK